MTITVENNNELNNLYTFLNLQEGDVILYLGGRIDDDNLYPEKYRKYLNSKIKELNPDRIICHTHWYAKKYYNGNILKKSKKIDMVLAYSNHFIHGPIQTINPQDYNDYGEYLKTITKINPDLIYVLYDFEQGVIILEDEKYKNFGDDYNLKNIKSFYFDRSYRPNDLIDEPRDEWDELNFNCTDGFAIINRLINYDNIHLNIIGFSAFGQDEDSSRFTPYNLSDTDYKDLNYFDIKTSEDQRIEAEILKNYIELKKINNLENYDMLTKFLDEVAC
tara:strand:+ start:1976 stop:2803 length:828 start_codon:yes stop_codon:yes gene_type:complete